MYTFLLNEHTYNLSSNESFLLEEASSHLLENDNYNAMHELYHAFYSNILRRLEYYGSEEILFYLKKKNLYQKEEQNILLRWQELEVKDIQKVLKHFKLLNKRTISLFVSFDYYKNETLEHNYINQEYLYSFFYLLKNDLFAYEYIENSKKDGIDNNIKHEVVTKFISTAL